MSDLDPYDRKILSALTENARLSMVDLAARVGLSKTPVAARVRALEEKGVIQGYRAILSPEKLDLQHVAYVEVKLSDTRQSALAKFNDAARAVPEIEECYMIAGGFDYLIKVRSRDIVDYRRVLGETISSLPHVAATSTYIAMEAVVEQSYMTV
ncbi:Lrp/AsnC family transcriptional regulator [Maritimibacter dapengensis]|uniref:Lrp/AsnC ligand binding domain-containing protein n=1 Tax=Maritimibacter dapengensis TaxID=2836868 RepID=A0ABS6SZF4_9RHOB|nr:Lrp/AsnC ligand binding domain-containing protein [Maritimibacter dapengensis]MBV7377731.1 Lrp/AsnC ligand binding domain-containing protein [Maritimibacter dapengensis]